MRKPLKHDMRTGFYPEIGRFIRVFPGQIVLHRTGCDIGKTEKVKMPETTILKRGGATENRKTSVFCVDSDGSREKVQGLPVEALVGADRVVVGHPKYLLA